MLQRTIAGGLVFLVGTAMAHATLINGTSLQDALDEITQDGHFQNVNTSQHAPDQLWTVASIGTGTVMLMLELDANASHNALGLYDPLDPTKTMQLFSGADSPHTRIGIVRSTTDSTIFGTCLYSGFGCTPTGNTLDTDGHFGLYLDANGMRFYSDPSLNTDAATDGTTDHLVAFAGDGGDKFDGLGIFAAGEYILGWEAQPLTQSDRDYDDMVVLMESVVPVPEPGTLALLGAALLAFGLVRFGRSNSNRQSGAAA